ncbi:MAG: hypothetical protein JNK05_02215 [Myxococcales bacterium]|nr:hypothetical protein [Myxococcales bacterium]
MSKQIIDATVLADARLKSGDRASTANAAIEAGTPSLLPDYAVKEFKNGPLANFVLVHNKCGEVADLGELIAWCGSHFRQPHRTGTILEALRVATAGKQSTSLTRIKYELRIRIARAWKRRRSGTQRFSELACYRGEDLNNGLTYDDGANTFVLRRRKCDAEGECSMAVQIADRAEELQALVRAIESDPKPESKKRCSALRILLDPEGLADFDERRCRALGDAVYALLCPVDAEIVTTNVRDHEPLATALGRTVRAP